MPRAMREKIKARQYASPLHLARNLVVLDGVGWAPSAGSRIALAVFKGSLGFGPEPYESPTTIVPYSNLTDITFEHRTKTTRSGGGFMGGGFGLTGVAEGMAIAALLNSLTTRTSTTHWVIAQVLAHDGKMTLFMDNWAFQGASQLFRVPRDYIVSSHAVALDQESQSPRVSAGGEVDIVSELERLSALLASGALTDDEFVSAKLLLLRRAGGG